MSLVPTASWITPNNPLFLLANISSLQANNINTSNLNAINISAATLSVSSITDFYADIITCSSIYSDGLIEANEFSSIFLYGQDGSVSSLKTQHIILDNATIDVINGDILLLNGIPIATTSTSVSSLQDWAFYPAIQDVDMNNFNLSNLNNLNSQNIFNALNIQTDTASCLTTLTSPSATITQLRTTGASTTTLAVQTITNGANPISVASQTNLGTATASNLLATAGAISSLQFSTLIGGAVTFRSLSTINISTGAINGTPVISGSNWSVYPAIQTVQMAGNALSNSGNNIFTAASNTYINSCNGDVAITANGGLSVASVSEVSLHALNGNRGQITLLADGGYLNGVPGFITLTANGNSIGGVGLGGSIELTANTPIGTVSNLTSKISLSAAGINSYAGAVPPIGSLLGYNFIYGTLGVNLCAGLPPVLPNFPGTVYLYGTTGVEVPSQAYMSGIEPYFDGINTPPDLLISGRYIIPNLAQVYVVLSNVKDMYMDGGASIHDCKNIYMSNNSSNQISNLANLIMSNGVISNANTITGSGSITGYTTLGTDNINTNFINGLPVGAFVNTVVSTFQTASISSATISSINGIGLSNLVNQTVSTFQTASISSATISSLNQFVSFNSPTILVEGQDAELKLGNPTGLDGYMSLKMEANYGTIESFSPALNAPLNLFLKANTFGININPGDIQGGYDLDLSGSFAVQDGQIQVRDRPSGYSTIYGASNTIYQDVVQPVIQWGNVQTNNNNGNILNTLSTPYATTNYAVMLTHSDNNAGANIAYEINSRSTFTLYWTNAGGGTHTTAFTAYGNL